MRILFVTSNRIGDAILSTGLLDHLLRTAPGARVTVAAGPAAAPLFTATPGVERVIALAKRRFAGHWLGLWWYGVRRLWDLVVDLRGSALGWFLPARQRLVLRPDGRLHRVVHLAGLVGRAGDPPAPHIYTGTEHRAVAERLIPGERPVLAVGPTANWGGKQWPIERFVSLVASVTGPDGILPGARVAVFGAASERAMAAPLLDGLSPERLIDLVGKVDLLTAAACLERSALYVGNDSGLMHLAAATGIPTLGLFGPSRETLYGPWGAHAASVRTDLSYDEILSTPGYDYRKSDTHMGTLSVGKVVAALETLWRARAAA